MGEAFGQGEAGGYYFFRTDPNLNLKALRTIKQQASNNASVFNDRKDELKAWYTRYFFREFSNPNEVSSLAAKRRDLSKDLKGRNQQFRQYVIETARTYMTAFVTNKVRDAEKNFHPAVRYNAMLVIGDFNAVEQGGGNPKTIPDARALAFMMQQLDDPNQIDIVKVAALVGILRHARLDWGENKMAGKGNVAAKMMELASTTSIPEGRHPSVHVWMRRRAVDVLASLGAIGRVEGADQVIEALVANPDEDILLRCTAGRALSLVQQGAKMDFVLASNRLGALAVAATQSELDWIKEYKRRKAAEESTPGAGGGGVTSTTGATLDTNDAAQMMGVEVEEVVDDETTGFDGLGGTGATSAAEEENPEVQLAQRRFLSKLLCISKGLQGIESAVSEADKAKVETIRSQLDLLMEATTPPDDDYSLDALAKNLKKASRDMGRLTENLPPFKPTTPVSAPVSAAPARAATPTGS